MSDSVPAVTKPDTSEKKNLGLREQGKQERRRRIIEAARSLIRETGDPGLSMRDLAKRAGVSLATPYNLFGSKRAIVLAVLDDAREFQMRFADLRSTDPIERIFAAVELELDIYKTDPVFYKTFYMVYFDVSDESRNDIYTPKRIAFWTGLLAEAIKAGALSSEINEAVLFQQLEFVRASSLLGWVAGEISDNALIPTVHCGYSLILSAICRPGWQGPLKVRFADSQKKILMARTP